MPTQAQIAKLKQAQKEARAQLDAELAAEQRYPASHQKVGLIAHYEFQLAKLALALRGSEPSTDIRTRPRPAGPARG